jgi:hypothetical protein
VPELPLDWVSGDLTALSIPAHCTALRAGGERFLTGAFRATGALAADNRVSAITRLEEWSGGSTGRKMLLSVRYATPSEQLPVDLFVKFSRDFTDPIRDRGRHQMQSEVRFALLSRSSEFPIAVPQCLFADYHQESGTGILISARIPFGSGSIERHYDKCMDEEIPEPLEHYQAITRALARLAGTHKAGRLGAGLAGQFPFDPRSLSLGERPFYTAQQLRNRVARFAEFVHKHPGLLPDRLTSAAFIARLGQEVALFPDHEQAIKRFLVSRPELMALCHWNANVDNAWFWRSSRGALECGLLDWGHVSELNVAMALWGSFSAASLTLWEQQLESLLSLFVAELQRAGGPELRVTELKLHLHLYIVLMGLSWLMDVPALIEGQLRNVPEAEFNIRLRTEETTRVRLHMMTTFLYLWDTQSFGTLIDRMQGAANHEY